MEIRKHETQSGTIIISNPTAAAVKLAQSFEKKGWAKFSANGDIVTFSANRRDFEKLGATFVKPVAQPVAPSNAELGAQIEKCKAEIARLETLRAEWDAKQLFDLGAEARSEIRLNQERIENLEKRIAGIPTSTITDEQVALSDYVLSDKYNDA